MSMPVYISSYRKFRPIPFGSLLMLVYCFGPAHLAGGLVLLAGGYLWQLAGATHPVLASLIMSFTASLLAVVPGAILWLTAEHLRDSTSGFGYNYKNRNLKGATAWWWDNDSYDPDQTGSFVGFGDVPDEANGVCIAVPLGGFRSRKPQIFEVLKGRRIPFSPAFTLKAKLKDGEFAFRLRSLHDGGGSTEECDAGHMLTIVRFIKRSCVFSFSSAFRSAARQIERHEFDRDAGRQRLEQAQALATEHRTVLIRALAAIKRATDGIEATRSFKKLKEARNIREKLLVELAFNQELEREVNELIDTERLRESMTSSTCI